MSETVKMPAGYYLTSTNWAPYNDRGIDLDLNLFHRGAHHVRVCEIKNKQFSVVRHSAIYTCDYNGQQMEGTVQEILDRVCVMHRIGVTDNGSS
jgi:hypothetical protein